jgi:protein-S-isoprenylcysteine O-methyltransferase Ste14
MLLSTFGAFINFHKQILKEEKFLRGHYGAAYEEYKKNVRRYL